MITITHGGQTGVDRGAHEAAIDNGWRVAGYMPRDQRDETFGDRWRCLANVGGTLCLVELTVRPTVHVDGDPGDEDDRAARRNTRT